VARERGNEGNTMSETSLPEVEPLESALAFIKRLASGARLADMKGVSEATLEALYARAHALYTQGKYADAGQLFAQLVMHSHLDRRFHKGVGACLQMQGRHEEALKYYGVASMLALTDPHPVVHIAECLFALSRTEEANRALRFALGQIKGEAQYAALGERVQALLELSARAHGQQAGQQADSAFQPTQAGMAQ